MVHTSGQWLWLGKTEGTCVAALADEMAICCDWFAAEWKARKEAKSDSEISATALAAFEAARGLGYPIAA